ncbi:unnamed protein product [Rotaria sordida]|uniref:Uncharacterized protein n=1 Tax=Rotaria sordida TaxID=392033 RepID=A0A819LF76_9BILA|nr:unnamed protein product [Rotaria sordida]CAF3965045.1 unnamed protein product [Rotaria sordida]CAF4005979.1 unnamed protein product [Rotaria sordida]
MIKQDPITISWGPCKDDDENKLIGYIVGKHNASRNVWQRTAYNIFTYTTTGFTGNVAHRFHNGYVNVDICQFTIKYLLDEGSYLIEAYCNNSEDKSLKLE